MGDLDGASHAGAEGFLVLDELVGRQDQHDSIDITGGHPANAEGDGGGGVAFGGFAEDVFSRQGIAENGADFDFLFPVGEDEDIFPGDQAVEPVHGLFEQGLAAKELQQLFGPGVTTEGPEASAAASSKNDSVGGWSSHGK